MLCSDVGGGVRPRRRREAKGFGLRRSRAGRRLEAIQNLLERVPEMKSARPAIRRGRNSEHHLRTDVYSLFSNKSSDFLCR
jgi:hypothetical protein